MSAIVRLLLLFHIMSAWDCSVLCIKPVFIVQKAATGFTVAVGQTELLEHTYINPLIFLGNGTTEFQESRGNFKIDDYVSDRVGLREYEITSGQDDTIEILMKSPLGIQMRLHLTTTETHQLVVSFKPLDLAHFDRIWFRVKADKYESVYGGGEQFSHFNLRGRNYPIWTREQGVGRNKSNLITFLVDSKERGAGGDYHTTYYPQSTFFSSRHFYCHLNGSNYANLDFTHDTFHEITILGKPGALFFNTDKSMLNLVARLSNFLGQPPTLPEWIYQGLIYGIQGGTKTMLDRLAQAQKNGLSISALWIQDWAGSIVTSFGKRIFWNWQWNATAYPDLDKEILRLKDQGVRVMTYINPHLHVRGNLFAEAESNGYLIKNSDHKTYVQDFGEFDCGTVDLTNPDAYEWYKGVIKTNLIKLGLGGWMADFSEYTPPDALFFSGINAMEVHNLYPLLWAKVNREAVEEMGKLGDVVFFMRAGTSGTGKYSTLMWAGDQTVDFEYADGIPSTIPAALSMGMSGAPITHFDIGGYTGLPLVLRRTENTLLRSAEMAVFTPVMRSHEGNRPSEGWQVYSNTYTMEKLARLVKMYKTLANYTKDVVNQASKHGIPVQRPLFLHYEQDARSWVESYEYLYGPDLLVAPVLQDDAPKWDVYLPTDTWIHLFEGKEYQGPSDITVSSPIGMPPVFYRKGSPWTDTFVQVGKIVACQRQGNFCDAP